MTTTYLNSQLFHVGLHPAKNTFTHERGLGDDSKRCIPTDEKSN